MTYIVEFYFSSVKGIVKCVADSINLLIAYCFFVQTIGMYTSTTWRQHGVMGNVTKLSGRHLDIR